MLVMAEIITSIMIGSQIWYRIHTSLSAALPNQAAYSCLQQKVLGLRGSTNKHTMKGSTIMHTIPACMQLADEHTWSKLLLKDASDGP